MNNLFNNEEKVELKNDLINVLNVLRDDFTATSLGNKPSKIYTFMIKYKYSKSEDEIGSWEIGRSGGRTFKKDYISDGSDELINSEVDKNVIPKCQCIFDFVKAEHPKKQILFLKFNENKNCLEILYRFSAITKHIIFF